MYLSSRKRKQLLGVLLSLGAASLTVPAVAAEQSKGNRSKQAWPQATLQAQANAEIAQDTVHITLATELSDKTQEAVSAALNKTLDAAMAKLKAQEQGKTPVKITSGDYGIWPMNDKDGKITNWRGHAAILLESADFKAASELASTVSDSMPVTGFNFTVSPQARAKKEAELLAEAAQAFRARAQAVADAFNYAGYTIKEINVGGSGARYGDASPVAMAPMVAKSRVPVEAGTEMVSVSVNGSIFLRSDKK